MKLSEMRRILTASDIRLTKSLGQNFLHDAHQLERIIQAAQLGAQDRVLEIGPGLGPLTEKLAAIAKEVLAIEKDRRLYEFLKQRFGGCQNLRLLHADALEFIEGPELDWTDWKMISNLPYSVASAILVELAQTPKPPQLMVVTLQIEVARRLAARPGEEDYGLLTLLVQLRYEPGRFFKIPAGCFFPEPEVDSGCIMLVRREAELLPAESRRLFVRVIKAAFAQRRKMMFKLLKKLWPAELLAKAFAEAGLPIEARAEAVGLKQFVQLTKLLHAAQAVPAGQKSL